MTTVSGATNTTSSSSTSTGNNSMTTNDFLKIMIEELQQQDPFDPVSSKDLVSQMGQIQSIQSNLTLSKTLTELATSQKLSAAGNLIGKSVIGLDDNNNRVTGTVTAVCREGDDIYLQLDTGDLLQIDNVTDIVNNTTTS